jgi:hypothetical protein
MGGIILLQRFDVSTLAWSFGVSDLALDLPSRDWGFLITRVILASLA